MLLLPRHGGGRGKEEIVSILVNQSTRVVVQGITGKEGSFHATQCKAYGTRVVAGVTPGKAGQEVEGIPVFNTVRDAVKKTECDTSLIFVPPPFCADAILEAADAGVKLDHLHYRRHSGQRHGEGQARAPRPRRPPGRTELPRRHHGR